MILWWDVLFNDGCVFIIYYIIEKREISRFVWVLIEDNCEIFSYIVVKLIIGNEY